MRLGLFAHRIVDAEATGIGRYVRELVAAVANVASGDEHMALIGTGQSGRPAWMPERVRLCVPSWPRRPVHVSWLLGAGPSLERAVGQLDVIHLLAPFPPARTRAPQVVTVHDVMPLTHPEWYPQSERKIFRRTLRVELGRTRRVVVPSSYVARELASQTELGDVEVVVVPHGISHEYSAAGARRDASVCARHGVRPGQYAVCIGAVSRRKNLVPVIRAITDPQLDELPLLIIGPDGVGASATDAELERQESRGKVRRTGYLPGEEVAALVSQAMVVVHPALEEGFGFVPLEAMAAGTPVITARVASIPEVVGDAGLFVRRPEESRDWRDALLALQTRPDLRRDLSAAGMQRAAGFSWDRSATTMLDLYREVLGDR